MVPEFYDPEVSREVIVINRSTGNLQCTGMFHLTFLFEHWSYRVKTILNIFRSTLKNFLAEASTHATRENVWTIYGIMGFIKLLAGKFELGMVQYNNCHRR